MSDIFDGVFDAKPDPVDLPSASLPGQASGLSDYQKRAQAALEAHVEFHASKKQNPYGYRRKTVQKFSMMSASAPESKPRPKVDLNPWAQRWFKKSGWRFTRADRYDHALQRSFDFMGIFDYVCGDESRTIGVQITTFEHASDHRKKIRESKGFEKAKQMGWGVLLLLAKRNARGHFEGVEEWL